MARAAPRRLEIRPQPPQAPPYPYVVGPGALGELPGLLAGLGSPDLAVVADARVAEAQAERLADVVAAAPRAEVLEVPPGEASKTPETAVELVRALVRHGFDRSAVVVAFGGGVIGDLAGLVAATFLRGVAFVNAPTSHLAMVDASLGGKTGVNLPEGKNLMGAFWQPKAVLADTEVLRTLPERVFRQGAVETFKHGLLADATLLDLIDDPEFAPGGDADLLADAMLRSATVKADIVAADTAEHGVRAHLNLGHTLAHALEKVSDHRLAHGDAVAYGLLYAAHLSEARGGSAATGAIRRLLAWLEPEPLPDVTLEDLAPYLARDKKVQQGRTRWVLLDAPQRPRIVGDVAPDELADAWRRLRTDVPALDPEVP